MGKRAVHTKCFLFKVDLEVAQVVASLVAIYK